MRGTLQSEETFSFVGDLMMLVLEHTDLEKGKKVKNSEACNISVIFRPSSGKSFTYITHRFL